MMVALAGRSCRRTLMLVGLYKKKKKKREGDVKMSAVSYEVGATSHMGP